jgi:predicted transcriptional regulator
MLMAENRMLEDLFLREKPAKILIGMKSASKGSSVYATILSKDANCTYSHTIKILNLFKKLGIVKFEKSGRIKKVTLTDDGWDIAHNLEAMTKKFTQIESGLEKTENNVKVAGPSKNSRKKAKNNA